MSGLHCKQWYNSVTVFHEQERTQILSKKKGWMSSAKLFFVIPQNNCMLSWNRMVDSRPCQYRFHDELFKNELEKMQSVFLSWYSCFWNNRYGSVAQKLNILTQSTVKS